MKNESTAIVVRLVLCGCLVLGGLGFNTQSVWATSCNQNQEGAFGDCRSLGDCLSQNQESALGDCPSIDAAMTGGLVGALLGLKMVIHFGSPRTVIRGRVLLGVLVTSAAFGAYVMTGLACDTWLSAMTGLVCGTWLSAMYSDGVVSFSYDDPATAAPVEVRCLTRPSPQGDKEALVLKAQLEQKFVSKGDVDWQNLQTLRILPETCTHIDHS